MYLARLKKYGPELNCVVTLTEELALAQAAQADKEIQVGTHTAGRCTAFPGARRICSRPRASSTTWGAAPYQNQVIDYDATVVERLRDAGAVLVAKLSLGALAQGDNWFRGQTKNPGTRARIERLVGRSRLGDGRRAWSASRSARRRAGRSSRRQRPTAWSACGPPTVA